MSEYHRPLKKFIRIKTVGTEEDVIILLAHEKLPDFCYACGRVGHTFRDCDDVNADRSTHEYGPWLRAATHFGWGKKNTAHGVKSNSTHSAEASHNEAENDENQRLREVTSGKRKLDPVVSRPLTSQDVDLPIHSLVFPHSPIEHEIQVRPIGHSFGPKTGLIMGDIL